VIATITPQQRAEQLVRIDKNEATGVFEVSINGSLIWQTHDGHRAALLGGEILGSVMRSIAAAEVDAERRGMERAAEIAAVLAISTEGVPPFGRVLTAGERHGALETGRAIRVAISASMRPARSLTKPQIKELRALASGPQTTYGSSRARVQNYLCKHGLARMTNMNGTIPGDGVADHCEITDIGRSAVKDAR
jgi:hypothetical protein